MSIEVFIPIFLVAVLTIIGNVIFFRYQFKKDNKWNIRRQQLTDLLLSLFFAFKNDEFSQSELYASDNVNPHEIIADEPKRLLNKIVPIVKNNLYLADNELHESCVKFLEWAHCIDVNERLLESHCPGGLDADKIILDLKNTVFEKYHEARNNHLM